MLSRPSGCTPVTAGADICTWLSGREAPLTVAAEALCERVVVEVCICLSLCILLFSFQNLIWLFFFFCFSPRWVRHESVSKIQISGAAACRCSASRRVSIRLQFSFRGCFLLCFVLCAETCRPPCDITQGCDTHWCLFKVSERYQVIYLSGKFP